MEIELKLLLEPAYVGVFRRHPLLKKHAVGKPKKQQLLSIYFDTPDLYLRKNESVIRVRKAGRHWVQTFKAGGQVEFGLHQRNEWESVVKGANPDLIAMADLTGNDTPWRKTLSHPSLENYLKPVFTTEFSRTTWDIRLDSHTEIELALDEGIVQHSDEKEPISEIELELKSGNPARLFDFALELQRDIPVRVSNISKADRGYFFITPQSILPTKAARIAISKLVSLEQGFEEIVRNCLTQVQANETPVRQGNPEGVHQMRVGLRRLRSALRLFEDAIPCPDPIRDELDWLASELGGARDWHVCSETLLSVMRDNPEMKSLAPVQLAAADAAKMKEREAAESVDSLRYSRLMLMLGAWTNGRRWREMMDESRRAALADELGGFAEKMLKSTHRKLLKRGRLLRKGTPDERHKARIAAKRARYSAEFFQSLYPRKRMRRYIEALADLQELIGRYHDDITAIELLRELMQSEPKLAQKCVAAENSLNARTSQWGRTVAKPWRAYSSLHLPQPK